MGEQDTDTGAAAAAVAAPSGERGVITVVLPDAEADQRAGAAG